MGRSATDCTAGIWHRPFLAAFSNSGNIGASARNARIHRQTVYKALERDQTFREKFEKAKEEAILQLETKLHELALAGNVQALMFLLRHQDPQTYSHRVREVSRPIEVIDTMKLSND